MKKILRYRTVSAISFFSIILVLGGGIWAIAALAATGSGPFIVHFDDLSGITSVGGLAPIIFMGVIGLIVTVMNFFIALELESRDRFLGKLTVAGTLIFAVLLFIAFAAIINVNV